MSNSIVAERGETPTITIKTTSREGVEMAEAIETTGMAITMSTKTTRSFINDRKMIRATTEKSTIKIKTTSQRITTEAGSATTGRARISNDKAVRTRT